jgi:predicted metal-dependent hydrolase
MESDPRLAEAVRLFNEREFFACHDVLEEVWNETLGDDRPFYQGLIHAAVCLFHFQEGNLGGARKMYHSAVKYLRDFAPHHAGIEVERLLRDLKTCFAPLLEATGYPADVQLKPELVPVMVQTQESRR